MPKAPRTSIKPETQYQMPYPPPVATTPVAQTSAADSLPTPASGKRQEVASGERHEVKPWTPDDDAILLHARQQAINWNTIAQRYFPTKTSNACRKRHERLIAKNDSSSEWDNAKLENLAQSYLRLREHMWNILARELGEKWETVEKKVLEKGLKNLRSYGRTRKTRISNTGSNDDSGLGRDVNPSDELASREHQSHYSRGASHDHHVYPPRRVSAAPSTHSAGFSSGPLSSAPSHGTPSRPPSTGFMNTAQPPHRISPETLPGIHTIFGENPGY